MNINNTNWNLLKSFLAAMEAGSLLGAAKKLGSNQPTLSRHIEELEATLGVVLFERTGRGLKPTAAAQSILPSVIEMSQSFQKIAFSVLRSQESVQGTVRITCSQVMASFLIPPLLHAFRQQHPAIQVELVSSNQVSNLLHREADIALRFVQPEQSSLIARKLGDLRFNAYASKEYLSENNIKIDNHQKLNISDIFKYDVIGLDKENSLLKTLGGMGIEASNSMFALRTDDHIAGIHLVRHGAGIGFMPEYVAAQFSELHAVLNQALSDTLPIWWVAHRELKASPVIRLAYDFLGKSIADALAA